MLSDYTERARAGRRPAVPSRATIAHNMPPRDPPNQKVRKVWHAGGTPRRDTISAPRGRRAAPRHAALRATYTLSRSLNSIIL